MGRFFAAIYDRVTRTTEEAGLRAMRAELLAGASGDVIELGAGTGLNLARYPRERLTRLVATEPDRFMAARLRAKADAGVEVVEASADRLPFGDASFDTAVSTLVLCTVPDLPGTLREVARVLRPGGRLLFLEHVRSDDPGRARWQDRLERPWALVAGGCHPNRDTLAALRASPLAVESARAGRLPKAAPIVRPTITGVAVRRPLG